MAPGLILLTTLSPGTCILKVDSVLLFDGSAPRTRSLEQGLHDLVMGVSARGFLTVSEDPLTEREDPASRCLQALFAKEDTSNDGTFVCGPHQPTMSTVTMAQNRFPLVEQVAVRIGPLL